MSANPVSTQALIDTLERRYLDAAQAPVVPIWGQLDATSFVRVDAQAAFWAADEECRYEQYMEDLVAGFHGQALGFAYLVLGQRNRVAVHVGLQGARGEDLLIASLRGAYPAIELTAPRAGAPGAAATGEPLPERLGSLLRDLPALAHLGRLTGIPTQKTSRTKEREGRVQQIERLLRGLYGETWGYLVLARPVEPTRVTRLAYQGFESIRQVSALVKRTVQIAPGVTAEQTDSQAQYCVRLLEKNLERLDRAKALGLWEAEVYFFAEREDVLDRTAALLRAIFAGEDSVPDPLRTFRCAQMAAPAGSDPFVTLLNSHELAVLTQLPREEMPGYAVRDYARFDVALPAASAGSEAIRAGKILDGASYTGNWYEFPLPDLAKHGLVVGVTGSGKTNTLFHLLDRVWNKGQGRPFLVIEPAKAEYRDLRTAAGFDALRIFTLGDERCAPFRLNPFEFEIADEDNRIHVQTHIDYLKSVFNASFVLYAPMPYVLETCLHEIYQDKGWDLTTSQNRRLPPQERGREAAWPVFPTLGDLYAKIDEVVDRLGYEERIQMDVKAGLKARIGSLRLGGKGLMLDVRHSVPMRDLLAQPAVLELERIGDDDEKAFLIGLLLTRLYEYRVVQARAASRLPTLQHVTVFEEAHRLLKNVPTDVGTEEANVKGQAVETFANMLSEIRAYGQGVLIAEQIPSKLAPDAIKNTNLKILHRIVAEDDRATMGGAMNLDDAQKRFVTALATGQAAVYAEGADRPYLVQVYDFKGNGIKGHLKDKQVAAAMAQFAAQPLYEPLPGYNQYVQPLFPPDGRGGSDVRDLALAVTAHAEFPATFGRYFLSAVAEPRQAVYGYQELARLADRVVRPRPDQEKPVALYVMLQAAAGLLEDRGRRHGWPYDVVEGLRHDLVAVLADVVCRYENRQDALEALAGKHTPALQAFAGRYRQLCSRAPIPYAGCAFCASQCFYRYEAAPLAEDRGLARDFLDTLQNAPDDAALWRGLARLSREAAGRLVRGVGPAVAQEVALCFATQMGAAQRLSSASQKKLVRNIKEALK